MDDRSVTRTPVLDSIATRVAAFAKEEKLFRRTQRVLAAVSGGPDSVALLHVLLRLRQSLGFEVVACHFDHQLRAESAQDLAYVGALCAGLGVECLTGEGDVAAMARQQRRGVEEIARAMRYQFLAFVAGKERADCVATGHTYDDQAETVLMRVVRGSGVRGIRGMLPVAPVPGAGGQRLVRPLLPVRRSETEAICTEAGTKPLLDASNADVAFTRNRLRHQTLEALRAVNPSVETALVGLAQSARELFAGVERESFSLQPLERGPVGAILPLVRFRELGNEALMLLVEREASFYSLKPETNRTRVHNLRTVLGRGSGQVRFGDTIVEVSSGKVRVGPELLATERFEPKLLNVPGTTLAGPWRVTVATDPLPDTAGAVTAVVASQRVRGVVRLRLLSPGDRMYYQGIERKVSDILSNAKIPAWERVGMVAFADSERVLALFGSSGVISEDVAGADALYVRLAQVQPAPGAPLSHVSNVP